MSVETRLEFHSAHVGWMSVSDDGPFGLLNLYAKGRLSKRCEP